MAAVAQAPSQHPLLRHPRPITGDSAKAHRMLDLIADSEENLTGLNREKSKTTKWLERPLQAHQHASDVESEKELEHSHNKISRKVNLHGGEQPSLMSMQWTTPHRPTLLDSENAVQTCVEPESRLGAALTKRRPEPLQALRPVSYNPQHLLSPEWTASPAAMSPNTQRQRPISLQPNSHHIARGSCSSISSTGSAPRFLHPQTWPAPPPQTHTHGRAERPLSYQTPSSAAEEGYFSSLGSPQQSSERRPRPMSFATFQHRDRRTSKIASSRGLRNNSYPNVSRPNTAGAPKAIPGEHMEGGTLCDQFADNEVGPPSPSSPIRTAFEGFERLDTKSKPEKKHKNRWSQPFKKLRKRRESSATYEPKPILNMDNLRQMNLTEQNLHWYERQVDQSPRASHTSTPATKPLPTPSYSPLEFRHPNFEAPLPKPFAPWAETPPSPAISQDKRRGSDMSMSPTRRRRRASSHLSIENVVSSRPESMHSRNSSFVIPSPVRHVPPPAAQPMWDPLASPRLSSRRGTPAFERTCIICKTSQEPSEFVSHRISGNCWHEPATCTQCLRAHIEKCVASRGWDHCTCPECEEVMTYEDISTFADEDSFIKWEE